MNNRALTMSVFMAVVAYFFISSYVENEVKTTKDKLGAEVTVVKAARDIKEAQNLTQEDLEFSVMPKSFVEPAALWYDMKEGEKAQENTRKSLAGWVAIVPIKKGEQITHNKIVEPSIRTGLAPQITPGRRAVAVPVNDITGVSKLVKPGDRVDLIAVIDVGAGKDSKIVKTVLQDVGVLAVGRAVTNNVARAVEPDPFGGKDRVRSLAEDFSFSSVTLEVDPSQAQVVTLLLANGDSALSLALRNNDDTERSAAAALTLYDVLGQDVGRVRMPAGRR